jgi:tetratricopeptide (TPR) repeat protein
VSKAQVIRKRALDLVRDQDWPGAIREYKRLVESDQNNPNVYNELADLYLKTNQKAEAYDAFVLAVDEYTRVGLFNNAVAVCKKVLRVLPGRTDVLLKLAFIRSRQGLAKEAESYYLSFLEKAASSGFEPAEFLKLAGPISEEMPDSALVLERLADALLSYSLDDEAGNVLIKLFLIQARAGDAAGQEKTRNLVETLGFTAKLDIALASVPGGGERTVITEDDLWTKTHSEGERIEVERTPKFVPPTHTAAPVPQPTGAASGGPTERDLYLLRLARGTAEPRPVTPPPAPAEAAPAAHPAGAVATEAHPAEESAAKAGAAPHESPGRGTPPPAGARAPSPPPSGDGGMQISALLDEEAAEAGGEDHRSHYDLGMAYLEMDLLSEAIREYQIAAKSPQYQIKCLEMIGLCFIKQNQPQLAIRQLTKGLGLIGADSEESLGIKYNLGLAHEMVGDLDSARTYFEDVYVVDVTFRDVADKISRLTGSA